MSTLSGRVVLVTGASRGLGKAIAAALAEAGADVPVNFRVQAAAAEAVCQTIRATGRKCIAVQADVSLSADGDRLKKQSSGRNRRRLAADLSSSSGSMWDDKNVGEGQR